MSSCSFFWVKCWSRIGLMSKSCSCQVSKTDLDQPLQWFGHSWAIVSHYGHNPCSLGNYWVCRTSSCWLSLCVSYYQCHKETRACLSIILSHGKCKTEHFSHPQSFGTDLHWLYYFLVQSYLQPELNKELWPD